jgi:hypothetical protein
MCIEIPHHYIFGSKLFQIMLKFHSRNVFTRVVQIQHCCPSTIWKQKDNGLNFQNPILKREKW